MYTYDYLFSFACRLFEKMGCPVKDAEAAAKIFLRAELRNLPSHGMLRIRDYFQLWETNRINTNPDIKIMHESPSTALVDGDLAIGMVAATRSMEIAIKKAEKSGTGWVATQNSNHFGIGSYYAMMALEHNMMGIAMTNANPFVAPTNSVSKLLGTNPVAFAAPAKNQPPFIADFSSTPIARGKLAVAAKKGENVAYGFVQDKEGNPSNNPDILKEGGTMLPLGSDPEHGSHKGYALGAIIDILTGVNSGANFGPFIPPNLAFLPMPKVQVGKGMGHFFGAMRIDAFQTADVFKSRMDKWIETFRNAKPLKGKQVLIPGDIEREAEKRISKEGIKILPSIAKELKEIADKLKIDFEEK